MNRRTFLYSLFGSVASVSTNPVSFFAPIGGWKSDVIVNPSSLNLKTLAFQLEKVRGNLPELFIGIDPYRWAKHDRVITTHPMRIPFGPLGA